MYLKSSAFSEAIETYEECIELIKTADTDLDMNLASIVYSNIGLAYFKDRNYLKSEAYNTQALECDGTYYKALIRRAESRKLLNKHMLALADYKTALSIKPDDKMILRKQKVVSAKVDKIKIKVMQ